MVNQSFGGNSSGAGIRIIIGLVVAGIALFSFLGSREFNPVTGENQYLSMTADQEIALGLQSVPQLIQEFGGLYPNSSTQDAIDDIGYNLVNSSVAKDSPWKFEFYVLNDTQTINAFALPGGPVFITQALLSRLSSEDEVAGVLAHEIVHVLARHSAQQIAKSELTNGIVGAVATAAGNASAAQTAAMIGQLINMNYGRQDEIQSDTIGICLMIDAGYDPNAMIRVMEVLRDAGGGSSQPEFFSTHPNPENRIERIEEAIQNASKDCPN